MDFEYNGRMQTESFPTLTLPKIGLGTGRLGGTLLPVRSRDAHWLAAIRSALELGYTHIDTAEIELSKEEMTRLDKAWEK